MLDLSLTQLSPRFSVLLEITFLFNIIGVCFVLLSYKLVVVQTVTYVTPQDILAGSSRSHRISFWISSIKESLGLLTRYHEYICMEKISPDNNSPVGKNYPCLLQYLTEIPRNMTKIPQNWTKMSGEFLSGEHLSCNPCITVQF